MKSHQQVIEELLDMYAHQADRWIMVSRLYGNMGTYHLMEQPGPTGNHTLYTPPKGTPKRVKSIDFRYSNNHMEWGTTKDGGLLHEPKNSKLYSVVTQWDQLLTDLHKWTDDQR